MNVLTWATMKLKVNRMCRPGRLSSFLTVVISASLFPASLAQLVIASRHYRVTHAVLSDELYNLRDEITFSAI